MALQELTYDWLREGAVWPFDRRYLRPPHFHGQLARLLIRPGGATLYLANCLAARAARSPKHDRSSDRRH